MPHIILTQHAEAKRKEEDPERNITERGREETERIAIFFKENIGIGIDEIIHSTKLRAKQTAEILAKYIKPREGVFEGENLEPTADPSIWAEKLKSINKNIIIVGHLPHLSKLTSLLVVGNPEIGIVRFRYSNMVCLERGEDNKWSILWIIRPDIIHLRK